MTRARRVSEGERTHSERREIVHDPANPQVAPSEPQVGQPRPMPERMCKSCERLAAPDTAYGLIIAPSGLGHYWPEDDKTLCGVDTTSWPTA